MPCGDLGVGDARATTLVRYVCLPKRLSWMRTKRTRRDSVYARVTVLVKATLEVGWYVRRPDKEEEQKGAVCRGSA